MKLRRIAVCAAALLALTGLAACDNKAGTAAFVGGQRITDADVTGYLTPQSTPYSDSNGDQVRPRVVVLETLIQQRLLQRGLAANGGPATASETTAARTGVLQGLTQQQFTAEVTQSGFAASFAPIALQAEVLLQVYGQRIHATQLSDVTTSLSKHNIPVNVSPRYGTWDSSQLELNDQGVASGLSGVLSVAAPSAAAPAPAPAP